MAKDKRAINLIVKKLTIYNPEEREWPEMELEGKMVTLMPFIALTIIPTEGWKAVFAEEQQSIYKLQLACFALVLKEDGSQVVEGICACEGHLTDSAEHHDNLLGYEAPGEKEDWTEEWKEWYYRTKGKTRDYKEYDIKPSEN